MTSSIVSVLNVQSIDKGYIKTFRAFLLLEKVFTEKNPHIVAILNIYIYLYLYSSSASESKMKNKDKQTTS